jgi:hypothetical protein
MTPFMFAIRGWKVVSSFGQGLWNHIPAFAP